MTGSEEQNTVNSFPEIVPTILYAAALPAVMLVVVLHARTHGKSSPAAAATCMVCGFVLTALVVIGYFIKYGGGQNSYRSTDDLQVELFGMIALCWCFAGVLASVAGAAVTW